MAKIAVIGDKSTVLGFSAIGVEVFPANDSREANKIIHQLAHADYAILLITERLAVQLEEEIEAYKDQTLPAIVLIPDHRGTLGLGTNAIKRNIEKAVGTDILFGKEG